MTERTQILKWAVMLMMFWSSACGLEPAIEDELARPPGSACTSTRQCGAAMACMGNQGTYGVCVSLCTVDGQCSSGTCIKHPERATGYCDMVGGPVDSFRRRKRGMAPVPGQNLSDASRGAYDQSLGFDEQFPGEIHCESVIVDPGAVVGLSAQALDIRAFEFQVPPGAKGFMVTPFLCDPSGQMFALDIQGPAGTLDLQGDYTFGTWGAGYFGDMIPVMVPQALRYAAHVRQGGTYRMRVASDSEVCHYVYAAPAGGKRLDINFIFAGSDAMNAARAQVDPEFKEMLASLDAYFRAAGLALGKVRYVDADPVVARRHGIIRSHGELKRLFSSSKSPSPKASDQLSANIFIVNQLILDGASMWGYSGGIPGIAGVHGTSASGVAISQIAFRARYADLTIAHEIGHFLGLFHSTEASHGNHDPLHDTPMCGETQPDSECPDRNNIMFWTLAADRTLSFSRSQAAVMYANPLVR